MGTQPCVNANDESLLSAWREGIAEASKDHSLKHQLRQRESELLPRFAEHYGKLSALPRRIRRKLQRQWRKSLAAIALLLLLGAAPALAATINVGGTCTLGRAITAANNDTTAGGNCTKGSGADRIVLPANSTHTLTSVNNSIYGPTGLPVIRSVITVDGNNSTIRRAPTAPNFRIFAVNSAGKLTLLRTTVSGGKTIASNPGNFGAGLANYGGSVSLSNSTISSNTAGAGGGGGVHIRGIYISPEVPYIVANLTLTNSTISGNRALDGSGLDCDQFGNVSISNSTISGNRGVQGAGLYNACNLRMTNSTVSGNSSSIVGGGIQNEGTAIITNSTISGNTALGNTGGSGGGVDNGGGSSLLTLNRTLISGNIAAGGSEVRGAVTAGNFNLFGHSGLTNAQAFVNFTPGATDITSTSDGTTPKALNAILNTNLANNGGPTRTHALVQGSPAIDAVTNVNTCPPPAKDQRGIARPQDGNGDGGVACDIGSFERRPPTP
jgi:hypothetical protein